MISLFVSGVFPLISVGDDSASTFQTLVQEYWNWRMQDAPEFASAFDVDTYNDKVESYSLEILETRKVRLI